MGRDIVFNYLCDEDKLILLCAGDKGSQAKDIETARRYVADYWRRK